MDVEIQERISEDAGAHEAVALREDANLNDLAREMFSILTNKVDRAPWKADKIRKIKRGVIVIQLADVPQAITLEAGFGEFGIRSGQTSVPDILINVPQGKLSLLTNVPLGPARVPALWKGDGKKLLSGILSRQVRCKGILLRPRLMVRTLRILSNES